jgi:hypothetical protein
MARSPTGGVRRRRRNPLSSLSFNRTLWFSRIHPLALAKLRLSSLLALATASAVPVSPNFPQRRQPKVTVSFA